MHRDPLGLIDCPCAQEFHAPVRLWQIRERDTIHVPSLYPVELFVEDIPEDSRYALDLCSFAWRGARAEGITSLSPYALVALVHRA